MKINETFYFKTKKVRLAFARLSFVFYRETGIKKLYDKLDNIMPNFSLIMLISYKVFVIIILLLTLIKIIYG